MDGVLIVKGLWASDIITCSIMICLEIVPFLNIRMGGTKVTPCGLQWWR